MWLHQRPLNREAGGARQDTFDPRLRWMTNATPPSRRPFIHQHADQRLHAGVELGQPDMIVRRFKMRDKAMLRPAVERVGGRIGDDHRPVVRGVRIHWPQVQRELGRRGGADGDGRALPRRGDGAVKVTAEQRSDVGAACDGSGEALDPGLVRVGVHPFDPAFDRRVVHDDIGRLAPILCQFGVEPCRALFAEGAAVASLLKRIDRHQPQLGKLDRVLYKPAAVVEPRKARMEIVAQVMIADARPDREGTARKGGDKAAVAVVVAAVGDIASGEQQIGPVRSLDEHVEHLVEALAVIFGRIVRIEPDMDICDLRDQHIRPLLSPVWSGDPKPYPPRLAPCKEGLRHVTS